MEHQILEAKVRDNKGRSAAREIRRDGKIPGIVYGRHEEPCTIEVDAKELERMLHHGLAEHGMLDLKIQQGHSKKQQSVLIREIQHDPVTDEILHVDFYHVDLEQTIDTSIPVVLVGNAEGVKTGGILEHVLREIEIECVAKKMPDTVELNVTELELGHSYHVRDLVLDEDVHVLTDPDRTVVSIVPPKLEEEVEAEEEAALAEEGIEPELVGEEKEGEEKEEEGQEQE